MASEYRSLLNYFFGTLSASAAISDTTMSSSAFTNLGTGYSTGTYLPLVINDPSIPAYEVVWVTAHTASSSTVTVVRGKEGTSARAWAAGTQIVCAPTIRDSRTSTTRAGLPSDGFYGERVVLSDEAQVVQKTALAGWQPIVGAAAPADFGPRFDGSAIPNPANLLFRGGRVTGNTNGSGFITGTFQTPFPNQCIRVMLTWVSGGTTNYFNIGLGTVAQSNFTFYLYRGDTGATGSGAGVSVTADYLAIGY